MGDMHSQLDGLLSQASTHSDVFYETYDDGHHMAGLDLPGG